MITLVAIAAVIVAASPPKTSLEPYYSKAFSRCMDKSDGITVEMHNCLAAEFSHQDGKLNAAYKAKMAMLPKARADTLRRDERAWLKRTEIGCKAEADKSGDGSYWPLAVDDCWIEATIRRTLFIKAFN